MGYQLRVGKKISLANTLDMCQVWGKADRTVMWKAFWQWVEGWKVKGGEQDGK